MKSSLRCHMSAETNKVSCPLKWNYLYQREWERTISSARDLERKK